MPPPSEIRIVGAVLDLAFARAASAGLTPAGVDAACAWALGCACVLLLRRRHATKPRHRRGAAAALRAAALAARRCGLD
eukprot:gene568-10134_t